MNKAKFKVGDRVKVSKGYQLQYNKCGTGTVIEVRSDGNRAVYVVQFDDKMFKSSFYSYQLEAVYHYKYEVGQMVTLTKSAIEWLEKYDADHLIPKRMYGTVFKVTKQVVMNKIPAYIIDNRCSFVFYEEDLNPAPKPKFETGQNVWLTDDTIERLNNDKIELDVNVYYPLEIICWYYYQGKVVYELKDVKGLYFYESELIDQKPVRNHKAEDLQLSWYAVCTNYTMEFCKRHGYKYDSDMWVGGEVGTTIEINDMFVSMDDIRYDVDNNIPSPDYETWYWKSVELYELGVENYMNYPSYCKGAPDEWTEERVEKLRQSHKRLQEAREDLERTIDEYKHNSVTRLL